MTSLQVDVHSLRAAARQLDQAADQLLVAHDRAGSVLDGDVPRLHGSAAAQARDMLGKALAAASVLGESDRRLAVALTLAADHTEQLESILSACLTPRQRSQPNAAP